MQPPPGGDYFETLRHRLSELEYEALKKCRRTGRRSYATLPPKDRSKKGIVRYEGYYTLRVYTIDESGYRCRLRVWYPRILKSMPREGRHIRAFTQVKPDGSYAPLLSGFFFAGESQEITHSAYI